MVRWNGSEAGPGHSGRVMGSGNVSSEYPWPTHERAWKNASSPTCFSSGRMDSPRVVEAGALGLFGLSVPDLLNGRLWPCPRTGRAVLAAPNPASSFSWGGPAHQDTWDLKPEAPLEIRGEFRPIPTNVSGIQICEHFRAWPGVLISFVWSVP
jgi:hypothetical protein